MTIFGYKIQRNASLRTNPFSIFLLIMMAATFYMAAQDSEYFAAFRFGDSIIPREDQLIKSGPYVMQRERARIGASIVFIPISGGEKYSQMDYVFSKTSNILELVNKLNNQPVAYLWTYTDNPVRQVWKIEVNQQTVLSYDRAMFNYRMEATPKFMLEATVLWFVLFLLSMISINRVSNVAKPTRLNK